MAKLISIVAVILIGLAFIIFRPSKPENTPSPSASPSLSTESLKSEVVAQGLKIPWEIVFLPDGNMLVTERRGVIRILGSKNDEIYPEGVEARGEGGLLGVALHPQFSKNNFIYLYLTTSSGSKITNQVVRYTLKDYQLSDRKVLLKDIPGAGNHDGGRVEFGPDGLLYITTGDAEQPSNAQNTNSLAGKILRIKDDGSIPNDNPFGNAVYSYGHRNAQGLTWDSQGRLWATEHGRSGSASGYDEVNLIQKGLNYGWPNIQGDQERSGMEKPFIHSGPNETWAPGDIEYINGQLVFTGLRGESIYSLNPETKSLKRLFKGEFGRLRALRLGPDGKIYLTTSNQDGRGSVRAGDDKVLKLDKSLIQ